MPRDAALSIRTLQSATVKKMKKPATARSLAALIALSCCFSLTLGTFFLWGANETKRAIVEQAHQDAKALADRGAQTLRSDAESARSLFFTLDQAARRGGAATAAAASERALRQNSSAKALAVLNTDGSSLASFEPQAASISPQARQMASQGERGPFAAPFGTLLALHVASDLGPGKPLAIAVAALDPQQTRAALTACVDGAWAAVTDKKGRVVASSGAEPTGEQVAFALPMGSMMIQTRLPLAPRLTQWEVSRALAFGFWSCSSIVAFAACAGAMRREKAAARAAQTSAERSSLLEQIVASREIEIRQILGSLQAAHASAVESDKLSMLGSLVAGVSHELDTPLGNLALTLSALRDGVAATRQRFLEGSIKKSDLETYLSDSAALARVGRVACERSAKLVSTFKRISLDQASETARLHDLSELARDARDSFEPSLRGSGIQMALEAPPLAACSGPPGVISQILANLLQNAIRHAFDGRERGSIDIRVTLEGPDWALVEVQDDGVGMAPDVLGRVFEPYFTTKAGHGGSGLGLSIAKRQACAMGGSLCAESKLGQGSTMRLRIPRKLVEP
jgi:signal transduction histidine kinase